MLNLLKESYALHTIQLWMIISFERREMFGPIFHTQFVDKCTCDLSDYAQTGVQIIHHKYVAYLPISGSYFSRCLFLKGIFECLIPLWLLLAHCDYSWHGTTPGPWHWHERDRVGTSDVASSGGGSPVVVTGGATCCSSVLSSRNVTRRRVCSVSSLRMFSACSALRYALVLRNLVPFVVWTMFERGSART